MDLLRELFEINKATALLEAKKRKKEKRIPGVPALGMVPLTSFVGNTVMSGDGDAMSEGKKSSKITVDVPKPRGKHVNDVLRSRKGGRMKAPTDFDRNATKRDTRAALHEAEDEGYFWYSATTETKNRSGEGPETTDHRHDGTLQATSKEDARAKVKRMYPKAYDIQVGATSRARHDREQERP